MHDLRTWIAKRISWKRTSRVNVNGESFVSEEIAAALFAERQRLVRKLLQERARRRTAEVRRDAPLFDRRPWEAEAERLAHHWAWNAALKAGGHKAADLGEARQALLSHLRTAPADCVPPTDQKTPGA